VNWKRALEQARMAARGSEAAEPKGSGTPLRGGSHVKPGKVKTWADMTPEERQSVLSRIKPAPRK
jgi:hypothetical protein